MAIGAAISAAVASAGQLVGALTGATNQSSELGKTWQTLQKLAGFQLFVQTLQQSIALMKQFQSATLGAVAEIEAGTRKSAISIAQNVKLTDQWGNEIKDVAGELNTLGPALKEIQQNLIKIAPSLTGVTSGDLLNVFNQVSLQFGNLVNQSKGLEEAGFGNVKNDLQAAEIITQRLATGMKTFGLRSFEAAQEVRALLTGTIDRNARLANQLGITKQQIKQAKAQGRLQAFILEATKELGDANKVYENSLSNITSVIVEFGEAFGRTMGEAMFDDVIEGLSNLKDALLEQQAAADRAGGAIGEQFGESFKDIIASVEDVIEVFGEVEPVFTGVVNEIIRSISDIVGVAGSALQWFTVSLANTISNITDWTLKLEKLLSLLPQWQKMKEEVFGGGAVPTEAIEGAQNLADAIGEDGLIDKVRKFGIWAVRTRTPLGLLFGENQEAIEAWGNALDNELDLGEGAIERFKKKQMELKDQFDQGLIEPAKFAKEMKKLDGEFQKEIKIIKDGIRDAAKTIDTLGASASKEQIARVSLLQSELNEVEAERILTQAEFNKTLTEGTRAQVENAIATQDAAEDNLKNAKTQKEIEQATKELDAANQGVAKSLELVKEEAAKAGVELGIMPDLMEETYTQAEITEQAIDDMVATLQAGFKDGLDAATKLNTVLKQFNATLQVGNVTEENRAKVIKEALKAYQQVDDIQQRAKILKQIASLSDTELKTANKRIKAQKEMVDLMEMSGQISSEEADQQQANLDLLKAKEKAAAASQKVQDLEAATGGEIGGQLLEQAQLEQQIADTAVKQAEIKANLAKREGDINKAVRERTLLEEKNTDLLERQEAIREGRVARGEITEADAELANIETRLGQIQGEIDAARVEEAKYIRWKGTQLVQSEEQAQQFALESQKATTRRIKLESEAAVLRNDIAEKEVQASNNALQNLGKVDTLLKQQVINAAKFAKEMKSIELGEIEFKLSNVDEARNIIKESKKADGLFAKELKKAGKALSKEFGKLADQGVKGAKAEMDLLKEKQRVEAEILEENQNIQLMEIDLQIAQKQTELQMSQLRAGATKDERETIKKRVQAIKLDAKLAKEKGDIQDDTFNQISSDAADITSGINDLNAKTDERLALERDVVAEEVKQLEKRKEIIVKQNDSAKKEMKIRHEIEKGNKALELRGKHIDSNNKKAAAGAKTGGKSAGAGGITLNHTSDNVETIEVGRFNLDMRKSGGQYVDNMFKGLTEQTVDLYRDAMQRGGKTAAEEFNKAFKRWFKYEDRNRGVPTARGTGDNMKQFLDNQKMGFQRAVNEFAAKERWAQRREAQEQEKARRQAEAAAAAQRREQWLAEMHREMLQNRLDQAIQHKELLNGLIEAKDAFIDSQVGEDLNILELIEANTKNSETASVEETQNRAKLVEMFGEEVANRIGGFLTIDEQLMAQLEQGTAEPDELITSNKIYLDPKTGGLIVGGADPDFDKINELIELQTIKRVNEEGNALLQDIRENTSGMSDYEVVTAALQQGVIDSTGAFFSKFDPDKKAPVSGFALDLDQDSFGTARNKIEQFINQDNQFQSLEEAIMANGKGLNTTLNDVVGSGLVALDRNLDKQQWATVIARNIGEEDIIYQGMGAMAELPAVMQEIADLENQIEDIDNTQLAADIGESKSFVQSTKNQTKASNWNEDEMIAKLGALGKKMDPMVYDKYDAVSWDNNAQTHSYDDSGNIVDPVTNNKSGSTGKPKSFMDKQSDYASKFKTGGIFADKKVSQEPEKKKASGMKKYTGSSIAGIGMSNSSLRRPRSIHETDIKPKGMTMVNNNHFHSSNSMHINSINSNFRSR